MPTRERVQAFVDLVVSGAHDRAIEDFYHADATMQENLSTPRQGRDVLLAHERRAMSRATKIVTHPPAHVVIDGDVVVIHWVFDFTFGDGKTKRLIELALQQWRGDRISTEQFFYDSATAWREVPPGSN
jgi:hypothetical protein